MMLIFGLLAYSQRKLRTYDSLNVIGCADKTYVLGHIQLHM